MFLINLQWNIWCAFFNSVNLPFYITNLEHDDNFRSKFLRSEFSKFERSSSEEQGESSEEQGEQEEPEGCGIIQCSQEFAIKQCPKTCSNVEPELCKDADCEKPRSLQYCPKTCAKGKQNVKGRT